jgi:hypothetical protein
MKKVFLQTGFAFVMIFFLVITASFARADYKYNYVSYSGMEALLKNLEQTSRSRPVNIFRLETFGYTYLGVPMYAVKLSDNPEIDDESKPDVLLSNGIHGNEWLPSELSIRFIEHMFNSYYDTAAFDHQEVEELINNHEIWIIPILNPDGRNRDEGEVKDGDPEEVTSWRKNVQPVVCPEDPNALGIDLNRTFSDGFVGPTPALGCNTENYNGAVPFAAPESRWIRNFSNNHMITLSIEGHSTLQAILCAGGVSASSDGIIRQLAQIYNRDIPDPRIELKVYPGDLKSPGQYFTWLYNEISYQASHDYTSRRGIPSILLEWGIPDKDIYGCLAEGKIGKYSCRDTSDGSHITSSDLVEIFVSGYIDMAKYLIRQAETPFAPRFYKDLSFSPAIPQKDLALVGSKINAVGAGNPGCLSVSSDGWDILTQGEKQITFNVQNNGTAIADIDCTVSICNRSDDPACTNPENASFQEQNVAPYGIKTFTHDADFIKGKEYVVTMQTLDPNSTLDNDLKRYVFKATADLFGTVTDGAGGEPLARAVVIVSGNWFLKFALTDEKGFFEIDRLRKAGAYKISILKQGYRAVMGSSFQFNGSPVEQNVSLQE